MRDFWHKQSRSEPLFPELEWSRPENKHQAGKLLIVGGNAHGFAAPAEAYRYALDEGVGAIRVLLPDAVEKIVGHILEAGEFAPSTPSGSFARRALEILLDMGEWADAVILAGDIGRNSETAVFMESFLAKSTLPVTLTSDAVDCVSLTPQAMLARPKTTLVVSLSQLQRLAPAAHFDIPVAFSMGQVQLVDWLHNFTLRHAPCIVVKHLDTMFVAAQGQVSTTVIDALPLWRVKTASIVSVWWLQNQNKPFQALTSAILHV